VGKTFPPGLKDAAVVRCYLSRKVKCNCQQKEKPICAEDTQYTVQIEELRLIPGIFQLQDHRDEKT
jgi:hypothetical protein